VGKSKNTLWTAENTKENEKYEIQFFTGTSGSFENILHVQLRRA